MISIHQEEIMFDRITIPVPLDSKWLEAIPAAEPE